VGYLHEWHHRTLERLQTEFVTSSESLPLLVPLMVAQILDWETHKKMKIELADKARTERLPRSDGRIENSLELQTMK
jgi:hypothetical protein